VCCVEQIVGSAGNIEGTEHWGADTDWLAYKSSDFGYCVEIVCYRCASVVVDWFVWWGRPRFAPGLPS
jgi:hypothetical protein